MRQFFARLRARKAETLEEFLQLAQEHDATRIVVEPRKKVSGRADSYAIGPSRKYSTRLTAEVDGGRNITTEIIYIEVQEDAHPRPNMTSTIMSTLRLCTDLYQHFPTTPVIFTAANKGQEPQVIPAESIARIYAHREQDGWTPFPNTPALGRTLPRTPSVDNELPRAVKNAD